MSMYDLHPKQCIVVDIETLALGPTAKIIQIAAGSVGNPHETFNILPSIESQHFSSTDPSTVAFWQELQAKDPATWEAVLSPSRFTQTIEKSLEAFDLWIAQYMHRTGQGIKDLHFFSRGKDFDFPILTDAYHTYLHKQPPWFYRNIHCLRDISWMSERMKQVEQQTPHKGKHNAVYDVAYECAVLRDTFFPRPPEDVGL